MSRGRPGVLGLIGHTPLVELRRLQINRRVRLFAKLESRNPGGSVKDRAALSMIEGAEARGELRPGMTVLEATSGNTGIGLALVCAVKGYKLMLTMSEGASLERRKILRALGAEIILTPAERGTDGAIELAYLMAREEPQRFYVPDQFNNPDNWRAHYLGTAEEIWKDTHGRITHVVASLGTTGTVMGLSRRLKELNPNLVVAAVEPMPGHKIQGLKNLKESYVPGIFEKERMDLKLNVEDEEAFEMARRLAREEGIFAGMSSGAALAGALKLARSLQEGLMVVILPDGGDRYLSTSLFVPREIPSFCFYNTLSRRKENFEPMEPGKVSMYSCGPTVDGPVDLDFCRRAVVADLLKRHLQHKGFQVRHVMNITDLDDRTIQGAQASGIPLKEFTEAHIASFLEDMAFLSVQPADEYPRASQYVEAMLEMGRALEKKGLAYAQHGSLYFDISKFPSYGHLSRVDLRKIRVGLTVDLDDYEKDNPRDFTLFKRSTLAELKQGISYTSPWGQVRPGWHIECAAMASQLLGESIDIHTSGRALMFPHHENEIAICESLSGKRFCRYWIHSERVLLEGKSVSGRMTLKELLSRGFKGREIRFLLIGTHYRKPLHFSIQALHAARKSLARLDRVVFRLRWSEGEGGKKEVSDWISQAREDFESAMDDDLNVSVALAAVFRLAKQLNPALEEGSIGREEASQALRFLEGVNNVLQILELEACFPKEGEILGLIAKREKARKRRDWVEADRIRDELSGMGVLLVDTPSGTRWIPKSSE